MKKLEYHLVDVFTDRPFGGNQLAVFPQADGLSASLMQTIARELNLSESVFVHAASDPAHHCRLRIFTPGRELPMAGHPTVGAAWVLQREGLLPEAGEAIFEEGVGPIAVHLRQEDAGLRVDMRQPIPQFGRIIAHDVAAEMLSLNVDDLITELPAQVVSAGVPFVYVPVRGLEAMRRVRFRREVWEREVGDVDVFALTPETAQPGHHVHSRMFAPTMNIPEDPATGAASGPLAAYLLRYGLVHKAQAGALIGEQGYEMGRPSLIHMSVEMQGDEISGVSIGGYTQPVGGGYILVAE